MLIDLTGHRCIHCDVVLDAVSHSNRSKPGNKNPWRICRECLSKNKKRTRDRVKSQKYSREYAVEKWTYTLANGCMKRAKEKGLQCSVTGELIQKMFDKQGGKCFWLGIPIMPSDYPKALNQPSVDRLDPAGDYSEKNCVLSCYFANIGRQTTDVETWRTFVQEFRKCVGRKYG